MNEMTKMILIFIAGVLVGVLAATSSLFKGEPEPAPTEVVTRDVGIDTGGQAPGQVPGQTPSQTQGESGQGPGTTAAPQVLVEQPVAEPHPQASEPQVDAQQPQAETNLAQAVSPQSNNAEAEQGADESDDENAQSEQQEAEESFFCMLMENSGQCRCYDAETTVPLDVSADECRDKLAEE